MADAQNYRCPWCKHSFDAHAMNCPACGAPVDVRKAVTKSGWTELPRIKDMTKIQFGRSFCQVEGNFVPVADFKLAEGDGIYFAHHLMLWKDDAAHVCAMSMKGGWKRLFAGLPMVMTQATGPGRIAFSKDKPGELIAIPLEEGQSIDVREHVFMIATLSVGYDWSKSNVWYTTVSGDGKSQETHYPVGMFIDRFTAEAGPGLLLLHGAGNVFVRDLKAGESILIKPTALLYKDPAVSMRLHFDYPHGTWRSWRSWGNRYLWLRLTGPGKVGVQSNFEPIEDPGTSLSGSYPMATTSQW